MFSLRKRISFLYQERKRIEVLKHFEKKLSIAGFQNIAGIDEVGRGALAGPVVAAAVILQGIDSFFVAHLKDSKKINKAKREYLFDIIKEKSFDLGIGVVSSDIIDRINIAQATFLAMKRAIMNLQHFPDYILVDAFEIPYIHIQQDHFIKGEDISVSIAAASIVAKVYRDQLMSNFHEKYPFYQFNHNVGYGTRDHMMAIQKFGICPLHRKTFKGVLEVPNKKQEYATRSLYQ
jgi:ribonuclease HII